MKYLISLALFLLSVAVSLSGQTARKPEANNGAVINTDGVGFQMVVVHGNGPQFPRLTSYQDANVMKEVNRQIDGGEFRVIALKLRPKLLFCFVHNKCPNRKFFALEYR